MKTFFDVLKLLFFLRTWIHKIEVTRISIGKTWRLHNLLAGSFFVLAFLLMATLNKRQPLPLGMHIVYAWLYVGLAGVAAVLQAIVYKRGHYFGEPKIIP